MSRKKIIQIIAVVFLILAVVLLVPNTDWQKETSVYGFISLVFGTMGSIVSIFIPTTYSLIFNEQNWKTHPNGCVLYIEANKHGCGNSPQVQTFSKDGAGYSLILCGIDHDENGNISIESSKPWVGKLKIS